MRTRDVRRARNQARDPRTTGTAPGGALIAPSRTVHHIGTLRSWARRSARIAAGSPSSERPLRDSKAIADLMGPASPVAN